MSANACPHCREAKRLARDERLVKLGLDEVQEAMRQLTPDERLDLIAEEHELIRLLDRIERERMSHA